jgi:hypothetical protein
MTPSIPEYEPVATVCGNEVRIFGGKQKNGIRPLQDIRTFPHHGAASLYATEFDDAVKRHYKH